jgi:hypothetical protein
MSETTKKPDVFDEAVARFDTPATSVEIFKSLAETVITNRQAIDKKKATISDTIRLVNARIPSIETPEHDAYVNNLVVIGKKSLLEIQTLRKDYTLKIDAWKAGEMAPEKELEAEIQTLVDKRNARAKRLSDKAAEETQRIQAEKDKALYEAEVKGLMKLNLERGLIEKVQAFEKGIDDYFMKNVKIDNGPAIEKALKGIVTKLKEETYQALIGCTYDAKRMSETDYTALRNRALAYEQWSYPSINKKYSDEAAAILTKWIEKIPQRVKELQAIAAGGDQGARVAAIVEERDALVRADAAKEVELKKAAVTTAVNQEVQGEQMSATFKAQVQEQAVAKPDGTRTGKYFVLDNPYDTLQVAKIISSIVIHMIPNKSAEDRIKMIVAHDDKGKPKVDKDGDPVYTPQVAFWLNKAVDFGYKPDVPGLTQKTKISTVAKAK